MEDVFIPIVLFVSIAVVVSLAYWYRYRARSDMQVTIRAAIERGQELSPEIVDRLGNPRVAKNRDLRVALIWLALAAGLLLCGWAVPDPTEYAFRGCLAGAAFPLCIGIAYLIIWRYAGEER